MPRHCACFQPPRSRETCRRGRRVRWDLTGSPRSPNASPPLPSMSQDGRMQPANRRYADPLGTLPQMATGSPITLIGYWEGGEAPGWPRVTGFVDEHWDQNERDLV